MIVSFQQYVVEIKEVVMSEKYGADAPLEGNFLINWIAEAIQWITGKKKKRYNEEIYNTVKNLTKDKTLKQPCGNTDEYMHNICGRNKYYKDKITLIDVDSLEVLWNPETKRYFITIKDSDNITLGRVIS